MVEGEPLKERKRIAYGPWLPFRVLVVWGEFSRSGEHGEGSVGAASPAWVGRPRTKRQVCSHVLLRMVLRNVFVSQVPCHGPLHLRPRISSASWGSLPAQPLSVGVTLAPERGMHILGHFTHSMGLRALAAMAAPLSSTAACLFLCGPFWPPLPTLGAARLPQRGWIHRGQPSRHPTQLCRRNPSSAPSLPEHAQPLASGL